MVRRAAELLHRALLRARSAGAQAGEGELTERFWPPSYHLIAKDILRFHTVYWPALLMAAELELPEHVFVHGFLLMDGEKMSKSLGNVLDPFAVIERFGADALRFYLLRDVSLRPGRLGLDGRRSSCATRASWPTSSATSRAARSRCSQRYRDGVVPAVATRRRSCASEFAGPARPRRRR